MRFYNQPHRFYCGIDLHARTLYVCVLDQAGTFGAAPAATIREGNRCGLAVIRSVTYSSPASEERGKSFPFAVRTIDFRGY